MNDCSMKKSHRGVKKIPNPTTKAQVFQGGQGYVLHLTDTFDDDHHNCKGT